MATDTRSEWRLEARRVIAGVLDGLPRGLTPAAVRKAVRAAYPFREKSGWAYKCWCREVRETLGTSRTPRRPSPLLTPSGINCPHCTSRPAYFRTRGGCILCGAAVAWYATLGGADRERWQLLSDATASNPAAAMALKDWLLERDCPVKA